MKKLFIVLVALFLIVGCTPKTTTPEVKEEKKTEEKATISAIAKVGSGSTTSVKGVELNDEGMGKFSFTTTFAVLAVDQDGKIVKLKLDAVKPETTFNKEGVITPIEKDILSKVTLKEEYGMAKASPIKAELYTQLEALENYAVGKTIPELLATPQKDGKFTSEELTSSVTITVSDYLKAIEKAAANLKDVANVDKIGLGQVTTTSVKEADDEKNASFAVNSNLAFVAVDAEGKLVYVNFDVAQSSAGLKKDMTTTVTEEVKTKKEKGAEYGMLKASAIGKEWFEQAEALETYVLGKTVDVAAAMELVEVNNHHVPAIEELKTSVTIGVDKHLVSLVEATKNLK